MSEDYDTYRTFLKIQEKEKRKKEYTTYDRDDLLDRIFQLEDIYDEQYGVLKDIQVLIQNYGSEGKILDIVNKALGDKENENIE